MASSSVSRGALEQTVSSYPLSFNASPYDQDPDIARNQIDQREDSLFYPDNDESVEVELVVVNDEERAKKKFKRHTVKTIQDFKDASTEGKSNLVIFSQVSTWSRFQVSRKLFSYICDAWSIHPRFLNVVWIFGEKLRADEESFTTSYIRHDIVKTKPTPFNLRAVQGNVYEWMYCIKFVEKHHRRLDDPFSIRATGVHVRWSATHKISNWTLLSPSDIIQDRLEAILKHWSKGEATAADVCRAHTAIILQSSDNWRYYVNFLEKNFDDMVTKGFYSKPNAQTQGVISADFADIRALHITSDKLKKISQIMEMNIRTAKHIQSWKDRLAQLPDADLDSFEACDSDLELFFMENEIHKSRVDCILSRCDSISSLISRILDFRNNQISMKNALISTELNSSMRELSSQALQENRQMTKLTSATLADTRAMKTLGAITGFFFPATFVATLFGSNFFGFDDAKGMIRISHNFWIYWVVTIPIFLVTLGVWYGFKNPKVNLGATPSDPEKADGYKGGELGEGTDL